MVSDEDLEKQHQASIAHALIFHAAIENQVPLLERLRLSGLAAVIEEQVGKPIPELIMFGDGEGPKGPWPLMTGLHGTRGFKEGSWGLWILPKRLAEDVYDHVFTIEAAKIKKRHEEERGEVIDVDSVLVSLAPNDMLSVMGAREEFKDSLPTVPGEKLDEAKRAVRAAFDNPGFKPDYLILRKRSNSL